jgi:uncharacterized OB-fold protein
MTSPVKIWRNQKKLSSLIGKKGKIISWTFIRVPPAGFENQAPYPVALVKLEDGVTVTAQVVDYQEKNLKFGQKVITIIRRTMQSEGSEVIPYGVKVRPS